MTKAPPPLEVVYASDVAEAERLADGPVVSVGVVVFESDDGPRLAEGIPDQVVIGGESVPVGLDPDVSRNRGFKGKAGRTLVSIGSGGGPTGVYVGGGDGEGFNLESL